MRLPRPAVVLAALALVSCACPPAPCRDWVYPTLRRDGAWRAGAYDLSLTAPGLALRCTVGVAGPDAAPTLADIQCGDRVERAAFVVDTGLWDGPEVVRLKIPLETDMTPEPSRARLRLAFTPPAGVETVLRDEEIPLEWRASLPQAGACAADCRATDVEIAVPEATDPAQDG